MYISVTLHGFEHRLAVLLLHPPKNIEACALRLHAGS